MPHPFPKLLYHTICHAPGPEIHSPLSLTRPTVTKFCPFYFCLILISSSKLTSATVLALTGNPDSFLVFPPFACVSAAITNMGGKKGKKNNNKPGVSGCLCLAHGCPGPITWPHVAVSASGPAHFGAGRSPFGEGNGTPLQYSHLENPMDGGAWWATVHGVENWQNRPSESQIFSGADFKSLILISP